MTSPAILRVDGLVASPRSFSFDDLQAFSETEHVRDFTRFHPKRPGDGVTLRALLNRVAPASEATYLTLHATRDDFAASIPLEDLVDEAVVVYQLDGTPYPDSKGGPFRFLLKNPAMCHTDALDDCANVKFLDRIELTAGGGRDTRRNDEQAQEALHQHG